MARKADLFGTIAAAFVCLLIVNGITALGLLYRFGGWSYPEASDKLSLLGLFAAGAVLLALPCGAILWLTLLGLDRLGAWLPARAVQAATVVVSLGWIYGLLSHSPMLFFEDPRFLALAGAGFLLLALAARGARAWRRSDVAAFGAALVFLVLAGAWLNFGYLRMSDDETSSISNVLLLLTGYGILGGGIRAGSGAPAATEAPASRSRWLAAALVFAAAAIAAVPLYSTASSAGKRSPAEEAKLPAVAQAESPPPAGQASAPAPSPAAAENVILISIDTLRADHMGIYGYGLNTTPNIDRFFSHGVVFANMHSHAPYTLPSHTSMFTGMNISSHKVRIPPAPGGFIDRIPDSLLMITEIFRDAGYATAGFTGSGFVGHAYAFDQGFDAFRESKSHRTGEAIDSALPWLEQHQKGPFFLFVHGYDVHMFDPPHIYDDLQGEPYDGKLLGMEDVAAVVNGDGFYEISDADIRYLIHLYDNELREVDTQLARLFGFLQDHDLLRSTVVILTADHGQMFWENRHGGHSWDLYETLLRVPLLISAPGHRQQRRADELVQTIDIAPTLLDLTGLTEAAADMQGTSLVPALGGRHVPVRPLIAEADGNDTKASITVDGYKYINNGIVSHDLLDPRFVLLTVKALLTPYGTGEELYDMREDPGEQNDLAAALPEKTAEYRALLFDTLETLDAAGGAGGGKSAELTPALEAQLRELGYIQ